MWVESFDVVLLISGFCIHCCCVFLELEVEFVWPGLSINNQVFFILISYFLLSANRFNNNPSANKTQLSFFRFFPLLSPLTLRHCCLLFSSLCYFISPLWILKNCLPMAWIFNRSSDWWVCSWINQNQIIWENIFTLVVSDLWYFYIILPFYWY